MHRDVILSAFVVQNFLKKLFRFVFFCVMRKINFLSVLETLKMMPLKLL